ncbi:MAG TPA: alpha/beta hydrolase [Candidatus Limnocylindrales bacterium]|jgi:pimeloyl-ACP methyl ester carboxylesterase
MSARSPAHEAFLREAEARLWRSLGVEPVERRLRLARLGTAVRIQQVGDGPPVLFLHGGSTWGTSWADLAANMPGVTCLLLDRPGTGLSEPLRDPVTDLAGLEALGAVLVPDVLDALGIDRAPLVATSFGGFFAFRAAVAQPARVERIVELGWAAGAPVPRLPVLMRAGTAPIVGDLLARLPATNATVRGIFRGIGLGAALDEHRVSDEAIEAYRALLTHTDTLRNDLTLGRLFLSPVRGADPRILLGGEARARIGLPVDLIWGEADPFGGPEVARAFAASLPRATLVVLPGMGHAPWMDAPAAVASLVAQRLAGEVVLS